MQIGKIELLNDFVPDPLQSVVVEQQKALLKKLNEVIVRLNDLVGENNRVKWEYKVPPPKKFL